MTTPTPVPADRRQAQNSGAPCVAQAMGGKATPPMPADYTHPHRPGAAQALADAQRRVAAAASQGNTPARNRMVAILHNAAMDLWDVATEQDAAQMWEEARTIASRILAACPSA
jgi:hypothetical protein